METRTDIDFGTFERGILSRQIAERIVGLIREQHLRPGDRLPPERELAARMGVSRPSLREALRALSIMSIIDHRQGSGTYVASLEPKRLIEHLDFVFALDDSTYLDLLEARKVLETGLAEIAARRMTDVAIKALEVCQARLIEAEDDEAFLEADVELHNAICAAAQNPILARIMGSLVKLGIHSRRRTVKIARIRGQTIDDHRRIIAAIRAHDPQGAFQAMLDHLQTVEKGLKGTSPTD